MKEWSPVTTNFRNEYTQAKGGLPFPKQVLVFTCRQYIYFENNVGKGEIALNEQFLLFPQCFLHFFDNFFTVFIKLKIVVCKVYRFERV